MKEPPLVADVESAQAIMIVRSGFRGHRPEADAMRPIAHTGATLDRW
jgi:hypothetical protein